MKKTDYDHLFFSRTRDFLDIYLSKQCSRSPYTVSAKYSCGFSNLLDSSIIVNER